MFILGFDTNDKKMDRRSILLTVGLIGCVIIGILFSYTVFGENADEQASSSIRMVSLVSNIPVK